LVWIGLVGPEEFTLIGVSGQFRELMVELERSGT